MHPFQFSSPIDRVPMEILSKIFTECIHEGGLARVTDRSDYAPINISSVCNIWRRLATSNPLLWSGILIEDPFIHCTPNLTIWIERSGSLGFSFSIRSDAFRLNYHRLFLVLLNNAALWKDIDLSLHNHHIRMFAAKIPTDTPQLRSVTLFDLTAGFARRLHIDLWSGPLVHLTHLSIATNASFHSGRSLANLHTLCLTDVPIASCGACLPHCPTLEELMIRQETNWQEIDYLVEPDIECYLPRLQTFKLGFSPALRSPLAHVTICFLVDQFHLPTLKSLFLDFPGSEESNFVWTCITRLVQRCSSTLRNLEMWTTAVSNEKLIRCIGAAPYLEYLGVQPVLMTEELSQHLTQHRVSPHPQCSCPNLTTIRFLDYDPDDAKVYSFAMAITKSRVEALEVTESPGHQKSKFTIVVPSGWPFERVDCGLEILSPPEWRRRRQNDLYKNIDCAWTKL
ncbi:hypothetical protein BD410DRAFT_362007 [Rickenella mellea]|uniref:Uncharacterized protein n=1 Tax=Rickenella mellea TaxID=50990 RepID=A0A4Y7PZ06_9AGAM|nr:hypothetical protein BD410DRAFT_362007 [Rickenella mellea]